MNPQILDKMAALMIEAALAVQQPPCFNDAGADLLDGPGIVNGCCIFLDSLWQIKDCCHEAVEAGLCQISCGLNQKRCLSYHHVGITSGVSLE